MCLWCKRLLYSISIKNEPDSILDNTHKYIFHLIKNEDKHFEKVHTSDFILFLKMAVECNTYSKYIIYM